MTVWHTVERNGEGWEAVICTGDPDAVHRWLFIAHGATRREAMEALLTTWQQAYLVGVGGILADITGGEVDR